jgi:type IV secretory pathway VirB10-like protein
MQNPNVLTSPFGDEDDTAPPTTPEGQPQARRRQPGRGTLIVPATWEAPADPTKVLYAHQVIYGLLERDMNSDAPGPISVLVTEQVEDMFGQGQVLIPQYTHLLGMEEARPTYGQERVPATFRLANFPDGRSVSFRNARAGDETGAAGIPGHVNNHWVKLGIGAVISAAVNFGVRQPFGSTEGFQPSLPQEYARDVGQGLQQPLQRAIQQKFLVPPTITQTRGFPVIIMLEENVSFMTKPVQVTK